MKSIIFKINNNIKIKKGIDTIWLVEEFVLNINQKKFIIHVVTKMMKKGVKFVKYS
jgi:hypothetical protein